MLTIEENRIHQLIRYSKYSKVNDMWRNTIAFKQFFRDKSIIAGSSLADDEQLIGVNYSRKKPLSEVIS